MATLARSAADRKSLDNGITRIPGESFSPRLNTDKAAMIAAAGAWRLARGERSGWDLEPRDDLPIPGLLPISSTSGTTS